MKYVIEFCFDVYYFDLRWKDEILQGMFDIFCCVIYLYQIECLMFEYNLIYGIQLFLFLCLCVMCGVKVLIFDQNNIGNQGLFDLVMSLNVEYFCVLGLCDNNIIDLVVLVIQVVCMEFESFLFDRNFIGDNGVVKLVVS